MKNKDESAGVKLLQTMRGRYIMAQALWEGIGALEKVPEPHREASNIEDMKTILLDVFPEFVRLFRYRASDKDKEE